VAASPTPHPGSATSTYDIEPGVVVTAATDAFAEMDNESRSRWVARYLGGTGTTAPMSADDAAAMVAVMEIQQKPAGTYLFSRDDEPDEAFVVQSGRVILCRTNADRTSILQIMTPGDIFGDIGQLLGEPAPVDAVVLEDATLLTIKGSDLTGLLSTRPRIAMRWLVSMARRLVRDQNRLDELLSGPLDFQLAGLLGRLANAQDVVLVSQQTLAQLLGARRPSIARSLSHLETQGLIVKRYGQIAVLDRERLVGLGRGAK
jgi:CRP-like cAMP-binding protein